MTFAIDRRGFVGCLLAGAASAHAQAPLGMGGTIIVPFPAGSLADTAARRYAALLGEASRLAWVVENHPGGAGVVAARQLLARPADGRTLLWGYSGLVCNTPLLAKPPLDFNPATDFVPVSIFINTPFVLFAGAQFPASNLAQLQQLARARAEPLTFMPLELGSANHLAMETLLQRLGVRGSPVAYRNIGQAILDIAEGRVETGILSISSAMPGVRAGKLKAIALLADKPARAAPDVPTVASQGFGPYDFQGWMGLFALRGTPQAALTDHESHLKAILRTPAFVDFLAQAGQEVQLRDHAQSRDFVEAEVARYRGILQTLRLI